MHHDYEEKACLLARVTNICRDDIFNKSVQLPGSFFSDCQDQSVLHSIQILTSMIPCGPNMHNEVKHSQPCLKIAQLL